MAFSVRSIIDLMQGGVNSVRQVEDALTAGDSVLVERVLSQMSAKDILECEDHSDTVLSVLIGALFSSAEESTSFSLNKAWNKVCKGVCDSFMASASLEHSFLGGVQKTVDHLRQESSGDCAVGTEDTKNAAIGGESRAVSREIVSCIAVGIKSIAHKLEEARVAAEREGEEIHEKFCDTVSNFLQRENVSYVFDGSEYKRSCIHAMALQYFFYSSDPGQQEILLSPLKEFLLGFFRYSLDVRRARSLHYALSMSGGVHGEQFVKDVLIPLCKREREQRVKVMRNCKTLEDDVLYYNDSEGNTLLHYALSSVYCSEKTVSWVRSEFGAHGLRGKLSHDGLSLAEIITNDIPYYSMFFSLGDTYKVRAKGLTSANRALKRATLNSNFADMKQALSRRTDELYKMHLQAYRVCDEFGKVLRLLCYDDEKVREAETCAASYDEDKCWDFHVPEILSGYKSLLGKVYESSSVSTADNDKMLEQNVAEIFDVCDKRRRLIGARVAASEVVRAILKDRRYVRRLGITAACSREYAEVKRGHDMDGSATWLSGGWIYDPHSWGVNRFVGMVCIMCKWSAYTFESICAMHDVARSAVAKCRADRKLYNRIAKIIMVVLWIAPLAIVAVNILAISSHVKPVKMHMINAMLVLCALLLFVTLIICHRGVVESDRNIKSIQDSFADAVERWWNRQACENTIGSGRVFDNAGCDAKSGKEEKSGELSSVTHDAESSRAYASSEVGAADSGTNDCGLMGVSPACTESSSAVVGSEVCTVDNSGRATSSIEVSLVVPCVGAGERKVVRCVD